MKWIISKGKKIWPGIALLTITGVVTSLVGVVFALISKTVLDVATRQVEGDLLQAGLLLFAFLLLQLLLEIFQSIAIIHVNGRAQIRFKTELFKTIMQKDYMKITGYHSGELLNRINSDVTVVSTGLTQIVPSLIFYVTKIVACFITLYFLDHTFAVLCLCIGPVIFFFSYFYRKKMKHIHKECQLADGQVKSFMQETLRNLLVIKSFGCSGKAAEKSKDLQFKQYGLTVRRNRISILANVFFYIGMTAGYYVALAWGAYKISTGIMTFGTMTAILQLVGQIQSPFQSLSALIPQYYAMLASSERIAELEDLPDDITHNREPWEGEDWDSVTLTDISFQYDDEIIIKNASFSIKKGEFLVIAGQSGTGKSTLLKILLGILNPDSGETAVIYSDGHSNSLAEEQKRLFSYVPQGNLIVSGSIRDNIAFFKTDVTEEEIIAAAKDAQILSYIESLPDGFDTVLGEGGAGLSEGQIQRLAVARAILSGAPILLLDEATSALDEETELAILQALKARKDKTCVLVSHKKAAFSFCDTACYFEDGKIIKHTSKN